MNRLLLLAPRIATNRLWARAGAVPSFHIAPARTQNARDLITGSVIGSYNSASPAWAVGPNGVLALPAANAPVIEYDPVTLQCLGARIWGAVTNLLLQSNAFNTTWTRNNVTITSNATASVDGGTNGSTLLVNSAGAALAQSSQSFAAGSTITVSIFAKKNASNFLRFELGNLISCWFNLNTGTTGTNQAGSGNVLFSAKSIEQWPNGWYRCFLTVTTTTITTIGVNVFPTNTDGASSSVNSSVFIFGAQLNTGPLAPYVPTTTTAANSTADVWTITGADFSRIYNQSEGSAYAEIFAASNTTGGVAFGAADTFDNTFYSAPDFTFYRSGASLSAQLAAPLSATATTKIATAFRLNDFAAISGNNAIITDASGAVPISPVRFTIGCAPWSPGSNMLNGYIRELAIFRSRRPNANLQAMTS